MSQSALASSAGVSLATLQNVEAGTANPSLSTLSNLLAPLGLSVEISHEPADWDALVAHGLPLTGTPRSGSPIGDASLVDLVNHATLELDRSPDAPDRDRKQESLMALLLAIRLHFPAFYKKWFRRSLLAQALATDAPSGRVIKLSRISRDALAEYL